MTTLRQVIETNQARLVPLKSNGWIEPYKNQPIVTINDAWNMTMGLVNTGGALMFVKPNKDFPLNTVVSSNHKAIVYLDVEPPKKLKPSRTSFVKLNINDEILDQELIMYSEISSLLDEDTFVSLSKKVIQGDMLNDDQLANLMCDPRFLTVFGDDNNWIHFTQSQVLIEIAKELTPRSRLLHAEMRTHATPLESLNLFQATELKHVVALPDL